GGGSAQAMRLGVGAQAGGEPYRGGSEALAATLAVHAYTMSGPRRERQHPLTVACDGPSHRLRRQPAGDARIGGTVDVCVSDERAWQPIGGAAEALAWHRQHSLGRRQG